MSSPPLGVSKQRLNYHWTEMWLGLSNLSRLSTFYQGQNQRPTSRQGPPSLTHHSFLNLSVITPVIWRLPLFAHQQGLVLKAFP